MIQLWFLPINKTLKPISLNELKIMKKLSPVKAREYALTRGQIRETLSNFLKYPFGNPLILPPASPLLGNNLGNINFSHCKDALLIGWSKQNLGIDIERKDRKIDAKNISRLFYSENENKNLRLLDGEKLRMRTLKLWVIKESAIKWQKGSLGKDISNWIINNNYRSAYHSELKHRIKTNYFEYKSWCFAVAHNSNKINVDFNNL